MAGKRMDWQLLLFGEAFPHYILTNSVAYFHRITSKYNRGYEITPFITVLNCCSSNLFWLHFKRLQAIRHFSTSSRCRTAWLKFSQTSQ